MLSFRTTYAIQILDLLDHSSNGLSITDIRQQFLYLPSGTIISYIVRQLTLAKVVDNVSLGRGSRYRITSDLNAITLEQLVHIVDDSFVMGTPVGFLYWQVNYLNTHPRISEFEQQLEEQVKSILRSITVAELLKRQESIQHSDETQLQSAVQLQSQDSVQSPVETELQRQNTQKQRQTVKKQITTTQKQPRTVKQEKKDKQRITADHATATI